MKASATAAAGPHVRQARLRLRHPGQRRRLAGHHRLRRPRQRRRAGPDERGLPHRGPARPLRRPPGRDAATSSTSWPRRRACPKIDPAMLFKGPEAYQQLLAAPVDAVLITSPPYFHPDHFEAAVAASKHVYLEKPVATDVHGVAADREDGHARARARSAWRWASRAATPRPTRRWSAASTPAPSATSCARRPTTTRTTSSGRRTPGMSPLEARVRNWVFDRVLSGDILVEQNIHVLDIVNWVMKRQPDQRRGHRRQEGAPRRRLLGPLQRHLHLPRQRARELQLHAVQGQLRRQDPALLRHQGLRGGAASARAACASWATSRGTRAAPSAASRTRSSSRRRPSWRASGRRTYLNEVAERRREHAHRDPGPHRRLRGRRADVGRGGGRQHARGRRRSTSRRWPRPGAARVAVDQARFPRGRRPRCPRSAALPGRVEARGRPGRRRRRPS